MPGAGCWDPCLAMVFVERDAIRTHFGLAGADCSRTLWWPLRGLGGRLAVVVPTRLHARLNDVKRAAATPAPAQETPDLSDDERAARLTLLAQRLRDPDGLDREALAQIEQLAAHEQ